MKMLEKLKELVSKIEEDSTDLQDEEIEEIIEIFESSSQELEDVLDDIPQEETLPLRVECTREESDEFYAKRGNIQNVRLALSDLVIQYERRKQQLMSDLANSERGLLSHLQELRSRHGIPDDAGYYATIPDDGDSLLYFSREEE